VEGEDPARELDVERRKARPVAVPVSSSEASYYSQ